MVVLYEELAEGLDEFLLEVSAPRYREPLRQWPGEDFAVVTQFTLGLIFAGVELLILYQIAQQYLKGKRVWKYPLGKLFFSEEEGVVEVTEVQVESGERTRFFSASAPYLALSVLGFLGWLYLLSLVAFFLNYVSYMMSAAFFLFGPTVVLAVTSAPSTDDDEEEAAAAAARGEGVPEPRAKLGAVSRMKMYRVLMASGIILLVICMLLYPAFWRMPSQIYRHVYLPFTTLTPNHPLVENLVDDFYQSVGGKDMFESYIFQKQMYLLDRYIYKTIIWTPDMGQYGMIGLITTPEEVITRMAGDCQGQAVVTASMLLNMGFEGYCVETPMHWWTHSRDKLTGAEMSLNMHGSAGLNGTVLPQPIDMIYTNWPARCEDCSFIEQHNRENFLLFTNPFLSFGIAWTGGHIWLREFVPSFYGGGVWLLALVGLGLAAINMYYAGYVNFDTLPSERSAIRFFTSAIFSVPACLGIYFLAITHYQFVNLHLLCTLSFMFSYVASESFNARIGTPYNLAKLHHRKGE
eukprot:CAMPEP_0119120142 /NCGR_PEP_ID=MMETSP1310-20130426/1318_1 /TAXON_ID=464262 /ORGANISM="Genus nov. species nov., Strain RCC2339" /LENGTH=519 /DNA_ID=CAMNT_0007109607 /DNA_START=35 /DNA_END=1594 /DNA_ORIENTATION=-